ncbi:hypothetical protein GGR55DRAFT_404818 [Xylaria sp. FL0064]|nr:hypothetical protein GGR55DRAFT_404818 [Xylaria sp. FL0064]
MLNTKRAQSHIAHILKPSLTTPILPRRFASAQTKSPSESSAKDHDVTPPNAGPETHDNKNIKTKTKTMAELDEELKQKMSGIAGDGGESGVEYEDGQPVAMKRGVKNNMFRYI